MGQVMTIDRDALVEKAAEAIYNASPYYGDIAETSIIGFQQLDPGLRRAHEKSARAALDAILPDVRADAVHEAAEAIRHHCTAPFELTHPTVQIDALIAWVADWIENPPEWVEVSYRKVASE